MLKSDWLKKFAGQDAEGLAEYLNNLNLGISWGQKGRQWWVATGEKVLLETDEEDALKAFLLGMAVAYLALPEDLRETLRERFGA